MRPWRRRWVIVLAGAIILVNVLALGVGIYLQHAATRVKHARANCVGVSVARHHGRTALLIEDDGQGFDPSARPADSETLGLISMRERAALAGCEFEVESALGRGTTISIRWSAWQLEHRRHPRTVFARGVAEHLR